MADDQLFEPDGPHGKGTAFALWLACCLGVCGLHRFYLGRPVSGLIWLFTFGLFGAGQLVDLLLLPGMVRAENQKHLAFNALAEKRMLRAAEALGGQKMLAAGSPGAGGALTEEEFRSKLLKAAAKYGGKLTVTQGVLATGKSFEEVEEELDQMAQSRFVEIDNDDNTGAVVYNFGELDPDA
ncbi:MAG: TM2 domain-containing protein [Myxococcota bacterium]